MRLNGLLTTTLCLALTAVVSKAAVKELGFTLRYVRMCLRPEFIRDLQAPESWSAISCATACAELGTSCQGFQLTAGDRCRAFVFDRCSHMVSTDCSDFAWAFVRNQPGLPGGQLCPDGFGSRYFGSTYKLVSAASWTAGRTACGALPGLTKYADAIDRNETAHFIWMKNSSYSYASFFAGGWRPGDASSDPWVWEACNIGCFADMWEPGQFTTAADQKYLVMWTSRHYGFDDSAHVTGGVSQALCECIDPFK